MTAIFGIACLTLIALVWMGLSFSKHYLDKVASAERDAVTENFVPGVVVEPATDKAALDMATALENQAQHIRKYAQKITVERPVTASSELRKAKAMDAIVIRLRNGTLTARECDETLARELVRAM